MLQTFANAIAVGKTQFIGYGKIFLNIPECNLPQMHILLAKTEIGIEALNLELGLVNNGCDAKEAVSELAKMMAHCIKINLEKSGFSYFEKMFAATGLEEYWAAYRLIDLRLAKTQNDIGRVIIDAVSTQAKQELMQKMGMAVETDISILKEAA